MIDNRNIVSIGFGDLATMAILKSSMVKERVRDDEQDSRDILSNSLFVNFLDTNHLIANGYNFERKTKRAHFDNTNSEDGANVEVFDQQEASPINPFNFYSRTSVGLKGIIQQRQVHEGGKTDRGLRLSDRRGRVGDILSG